MIRSPKVLPVLFFFLKSSAYASPRTSLIDAGNSLIDLTRRSVNLSNLFGSPTTAEPYEQLCSQPVFSVSTPWGSPYLLFERVNSGDEKSSLEFDDIVVNDDEDSVKSEQELDDGNRQVGLYFLDQEDALRLRDEMLQMEQMKGADMRVTVTSLGKAMRHAANLNGGLPTGQPVDTMTGKLKSPNDGGSLRYKIVPPKRELYYAARCEGKERVGCFGLDAGEDAELMTNSMPIIGAALAGRRKSVMERRRRGSKQGVEEDTEDPIRRDYAHMEGSVGIPVFHCEELRKYSKVKQGLLKNNKTPETPLFFSYDDLMESWTAVRERLNNKSKKSKENAEQVTMPEKPNVEVYNLIDVVTSMDRERWHVNRASEMRRNQLLGKIPLVNKVLGRGGNSSAEINKISSGLEQIVFVPSSRTSKFKEMVSKVGNGKARGLRPMKPWGCDAM